MKKSRTGYRIEMFWEEFGTINEGGMEDGRTVEVTRKPSQAEMNNLERWLHKALENVGLRAVSGTSYIKEVRKRADKWLSKKAPRWLIADIADGFMEAYESGKIEGARLIHRSYKKKGKR